MGTARYRANLKNLRGAISFIGVVPILCFVTIQKDGGLKGGDEKDTLCFGFVGKYSFCILSNSPEGDKGNDKWLLK